MDVWSVFPWRGGDSRKSSLQPNPGRTWPGASWSLGKIGAPRCDLVWHPFHAIFGELIESPSEKMRHNVQMGSRGIVLDVVRVAPSEPDAALSDASICLLAFGNAGRGSFDSVVSCKRECIYSLFDGIYYSDNRSNSRANTCNKPRLLEGMHLLDKRSTQALPVALMIHDNSSDRTAFVPATHHSNFCPINFRCWTLGWVDRSAYGVHRSARPFCRRCAPGLNWPGRASGAVTLKKLECSKQAYALDTLAWDNTTGF
ncbi:hypothetical protein RIF29_15107 [Crotalaria pallida]|uniref:Uncharacterized protein n=1 Tax=Crotalaria pallida TaxID=3830 RepID=A0AAN9FCX2_CROPI